MKGAPGNTSRNGNEFIDIENYGMLAEEFPAAAKPEFAVAMFSRRRVKNVTARTPRNERVRAVL